MSDFILVIIYIFIVSFLCAFAYVLGQKGKNKHIASVLAIFFGWLGLHKFYLGKTSQGFLHLFLSWLIIPVVIALFEGIVYLIMKKDEFDKEFNEVIQDINTINQTLIIDRKEQQREELQKRIEQSKLQREKNDQEKRERKRIRQQEENIHKFINIEVDKKVIELDDTQEMFLLNDQKLLDDIMYFIIKEGNLNKLGAKFNIPYKQQENIQRDLIVLRLIKENRQAYGYSPVFNHNFEYDSYKNEYNKFKTELISQYNEEINQKAKSKYKQIKEKKDRWEALEKQRKKEEIRLKLLKQQKDKELQRKVKQEMIENGELPKHTRRKKREHIPQDVKDVVWNRDGGKCVICGSNEKLEYDHIIPFSKGGSNTIRNLQLLCETCNRQKSNKIG